MTKNATLPVALRWGHHASSLACALALVGMLGVSATAQTPTPRAKGSLVVVHVVLAGTGAPLPGIDISIRNHAGGDFSDSSGVVRLTGIPSGHHTVDARQPGYFPASANVVVNGADTVTVTLELNSTAQALAEVTITDTMVHWSLDEFEQRRKRGTGRYITAEQIAQSFGASMDVLLNSHFPRVRVQDGQVFTPALEMPVRCPIVAYLDGLKLSDGRINDIKGSDLAGVEYYTMNQIPVQYKQGNSNDAISTNERPSTFGRGGRGQARGSGWLKCGVVLFWSKPP